MTLVWIIIGIIAYIALGNDDRNTGIIEGIGVVGVIAAFFAVLYFIYQLGEDLFLFLVAVFVIVLVAWGIIGQITSDSRKKTSDAQYDFIRDCEDQKLQSLGKELADAGFIFDKFWLRSVGDERGYFCNIETFIKAKYIHVHEYSSCGDGFGGRIYSFEGYRSLDSIFNDVVTKQREVVKDALTCVVARDLYPYVYLNKESPDYVKSVFMAYLGFYGEDTPEVRKAKEMKQRMEAAGYHLPNGSIIRLAFNSESPVNKVYIGTPADELYKWEFEQRLFDIGLFRSSHGFKISNYGTELFLKLTGKKQADFPLPDAELPSFVNEYYYSEFTKNIKELYMAEYILKAEGFEVDKEALIRNFYKYLVSGAEIHNESKFAEIKKAFDDYESVFYADLIPPTHKDYQALNTTNELGVTAERVVSGSGFTVLQELWAAGYQVSDVLYVSPPVKNTSIDTDLWEIKTSNCVRKNIDGSYGVVSSYNDYYRCRFPVVCKELPELYNKLSEFQKLNLKRIKYIKLYNHLGIFRDDILSRESLESIAIVSLGFDDGSREAAKANEIREFLKNSGYDISSNNIANIAFNSNSPVNNKKDYTADELYQWACVKRSQELQAIDPKAYLEQSKLDKYFEQISGISFYDTPHLSAENGYLIRKLYELDFVLKHEGLKLPPEMSSEFTNTEERRKVFEDYAHVFYGAINSVNK